MVAGVPTSVSDGDVEYLSAVIHSERTIVEILGRRGCVFLNGLPLCGMALPIDPQLLGDERVGDLVVRHCSRPKPMSGSVIWIEVIDDLLTQCIAAMVVRIYKSLGTQRITKGQLRIVGRVVEGDFFSWGILLHTRMMV
jgi:hypothetical protein